MGRNEQSPRPQGPIERLEGIDRGLYYVRAFDEEIRDGEGREPYRIGEFDDPETVLAVGSAIIERRQRIQTVVGLLETRREELARVAPAVLEHDAKFAPITAAYHEGFVTETLYKRLCDAYDASVAVIMETIPYSIHRKTRPVTASTPSPAEEHVPVSEQTIADSVNAADATGTTPGEQRNTPSLNWTFDAQKQTLDMPGIQLSGAKAVILDQLLRRAETCDFMTYMDMAALLDHDVEMPGDERQLAIVRTRMSELKRDIGEVLEGQGLMIISEPINHRSGPKAGRPPLGFRVAAIPAQVLESEGSGEK